MSMDMGLERCIQKSGVWRPQQQKETDIKDITLVLRKNSLMAQRLWTLDSSPVQEHTPLAKSQADGGGCSSGFTNTIR